MPITESAKKALRNSRRKRSFNIDRKDILTGSIKKFRKMIATGQVKEAKAFYATVVQAIDKASKTKLIKANNGSRKKSRLTALLNKVTAAKK